MSPPKASLPLVIAGPIVRHVDDSMLTLWLVTSKKVEMNAHVCAANEDINKTTNDQRSAYSSNTKQHTITVGKNCFIHTLQIEPSTPFSDQNIYNYDVQLTDNAKNHTWLSNELPDLLYEGCTHFHFKFASTLKQVIHGSCRKAHFEGQDALVQIDGLLSASVTSCSVDERPDLLIFTGDQVYVDDVAGPTLNAVQRVIECLGLFHESFEGSTVKDSSELLTHKHNYYQRENLLPETEDNEDLSSAFFKGKKKPIFTSVNAKNHLIALNEMIALYLLSWSSRLWECIEPVTPDLSDEFADVYAKEQQAIEQFSAGLNQVERGLAHIPVYMIFDDHDVTDDWNLTRTWEEHVYENPFSKRIVGNALVAYLICQGVGNPYSTWGDLQETINKTFTEDGFKQHDECIDDVLNHDQWHYGLQTHPPIQVLDTRTQRWRSESNGNKPSGLMDWEALCELQQQVMGKESVIMVSAAPVYGVKFIEAIQHAFITFGGALMVDAENWMAHRGTASVMLNIFRHIKTPPHFIILSGDVHYSFVYDISLRFRRNSPKITQFTCSGIHNQFPDKLITWFERLNRWLLGHRSPLNVLTKRRNMTIKERTNDVDGLDLVNATSLGLLELNDKGHEKACKLILANGKVVNFNK